MLLPRVNQHGPSFVEKEACGVYEPEVSGGKLSGVIKRVLQQKDDLRNNALNKTLDRYNPIIIGGDAFTMATLAFEGVQTVMPEVSGIAAVAAVTMVCGVIAGVINVGVGLVCLKESCQAFYNGDYKLGLRLFIDFLTLSAIGTVMILIALSMKIVFLAAIGAFFKASPYVLPVLFFIISFPVIIEILRRVKNIHTEGDLAAKLDLRQVEEYLKEEEFEEAFQHLLEKLDLQELPDLVDLEPVQVYEKLSAAMETLQAEMGVEAAIEVFRLILQLKEHEKEAALQALEKARAEIKDWNRVQHIRLFQQSLYAIAFCVSMICLSPRFSASTVSSITATQQFTMTAANAIPLYMDSTMPFKRNPPIVVPKVELDVGRS